MSEPIKNSSYIVLIGEIKTAVTVAQQQAAMAVNSRLLFSYWQIGQLILNTQTKEGWGAKVIEQLANDLKQELPDMKGLSKRNLIYMQQFAREWPLNQIVQQVAAQLQKSKNQSIEFTQQPAAQFNSFDHHPIASVPWSLHMVLLDKLETLEERLFYCTKIKENAWTRKVLVNQLERQLHLQQGKLPNNFQETLPTEQANIAVDTFKDPYFFDFIKLGNEASELAIENSLVKQISEFLMELGDGFAYMGRQYKLEVGGKQFYLDLLFYHTKLHCYVNIELKIDEFKPEYAGKSQFYLNVINEQVKLEQDNPTIGIILCKEANGIIVEYALKGNKVPIGVAEYTLSNELPERMKGMLPTADELKAALKNKS